MSLPKPLLQQMHKKNDLLTKGQKISKAMMGNQNGKNNRIFSLQSNIFDKIDSEEKSYWLGFIYADGWISYNDNCKQFGMKLSIKDIDHLKKLKLFLKSKHQINIRNEKYCELVISSVDFVHSLINQGVIPRKSYKISYPSLSEHLIAHFIRGYFDGDGWVCYGKLGLVFGIIGYRDFIKEIQKVLIKECNLNEVKLYHDKRCKSKKTYTLQYGGSRQCKRIYKYLYDGASIFLTRKHKIWNKVYVI